MDNKNSPKTRKLGSGQTIDSFDKFSEFTDAFPLNASPWILNGKVNFRTFQITVEEVIEPVSVLLARLQGLMDSSKNMHHFKPLQEAAATFSHTFDKGLLRPMTQEEIDSQSKRRNRKKK